MTIFMTTHYMEEADEYCDRVAIIDNGRIVVVDSPENLKLGLGEGASLNDVFLENVKTGEDQAGFDAFRFRTMLRRRS